MSYEIYCKDSLKWLSQQPNGSLNNVVTGIPDLNEVNLSLDEYLDFFQKTAQLIFEKVTGDGYCIFVQTDRRIDGQWIDKSYLLTNVAYHHHLKLIWHKIVCQRDIGKTDLYHPTYSHVLCYTQTGTLESLSQMSSLSVRSYMRMRPRIILRKSSSITSQTKEKTKIYHESI